MRYCVIASPLLDALYAALPLSRHRAASSMRSSHSMSPLAWDDGTGASASQGIGIGIGTAACSSGAAP